MFIEVTGFWLKSQCQENIDLYILFLKLEFTNDSLECQGSCRKYNI